jgi:hypothetical protein
LTNILHQPAVGLLFFLPGVHEMLVETREVYFHCSKALRRSDLWNPDKHLPKGAFPSLGQIARDQLKLMIPARVIDFAVKQDAKKNLY